MIKVWGWPNNTIIKSYQTSCDITDTKKQGKLIQSKFGGHNDFKVPYQHKKPVVHCVLL